MNTTTTTTTTTKTRPLWVVRRAIDNAMLGADGRWYRSFACVRDIKFYKRIRNAQKYGLRGVEPVKTCGNLECLGQFHAVYPTDTIGRDGTITDANGLQR